MCGGDDNGISGEGTKREKAQCQEWDRMEKRGAQHKPAPLLSGETPDHKEPWGLERWVNTCGKYSMKLFSRGLIYWKGSCREVVWKACAGQARGGDRKIWVKEAGMLLHSPHLRREEQGCSGWDMRWRGWKRGRLDTGRVGDGRGVRRGNVSQEEECQARGRESCCLGKASVIIQTFFIPLSFIEVCIWGTSKPN